MFRKPCLPPFDKMGRKHIVEEGIWNGQCGIQAPFEWERVSEWRGGQGSIPATSSKCDKHVNKNKRFTSPRPEQDVDLKMYHAYCFSLQGTFALNLLPELLMRYALCTSKMTGHPCGYNKWTLDKMFIDHCGGTASWSPSHGLTGEEHTPNGFKLCLPNVFNNFG